MQNFFIPLFFVLLILQLGCTKTERQFHIGILSGLDYFLPTIDGVKSKMTELGYVEGQNIHYNIQRADFNVEKYTHIVQTFISEQVDLIFVYPTEATQITKKIATSTKIPVVFAGVYTENTDIVKDLTTPGENITGVRWPGADLVVQGLEVLLELIPSTKSILVPYQKDYSIIDMQISALREITKKRNIELIQLPTTDNNELKSKLAKLTANNQFPDAILYIKDPLSASEQAFQIIAHFAKQRNIPTGGTMHFTRDYEVIFDTNPQHFAMGEKAAIIIDKILRGTPAGSIPVFSTDPFLQINYRALKQMNIPVSEGPLSRANEIIR